MTKIQAKYKRFSLGQRIGNLLVVAYTQERSQWGDRMVACRCDCGTEKRITASNLNSGHTFSCGRKECQFHCSLMSSRKNRYKKDRKDVQLTSMVCSYQRHARNLGLQFSLSREQCLNLFCQDCAYCGRYPVSRIHNNPSSWSAFPVNGIDRVDSSRGYIETNTVSCCQTCNQAKSTMSRMEFMEWASRVYEHSAKDEKYFTFAICEAA